MNKCAIYCRVSTSDQTIDNQLSVLREIAKVKGLTIVQEFVDEGISGAKGRDKRKGFDNLLKGAVRREFTTILVWSVDRIGRNIQDLLSFLNEVHSVDCDLYLHTQGIDTSTPTGKMMFGILSVLADWERGMIKERTQAGMERARKQGKQEKAKKRTKHLWTQVARVQKQIDGESMEGEDRRSHQKYWRLQSPWL